MGLALLLIIFKGSTSEGQSSVFSRFVSDYIEETAAFVTIDSTQNQLADINSVFAYSGAPAKTEKFSPFNTIQDNSVVSRGTILSDIFDEFSDRGNEVVVYEVQEGDTISFIASDFGVKVSTIINTNNLKSADDISVGMKLKIPPVDGLIHKVKKGDTVNSIAQKYSADPEKIISFNGLPQGGDLQVDTELIVPDGVIKQQIPRGPANTPKRFAYLPNLGEFFALPTLGFNWGRIHGRNGVDIANSCGTPVYASADGKIASAKGSGWNGGFGKFIKITHANGTETLYAHLSKLVISVGQYVLKNEQIGVMGSTGRSTGCHLHFEVHGAKNPLVKY